MENTAAIREEVAATEGARRATGVAATSSSQTSTPDPEVKPRQARRHFSAKKKLRLLKAAEACEPGELGTFLRKQGLYSSHLTKWHRQRERGELDGLETKKRGRKQIPANPLAKQVAKLEKEKRALERKLAQREAMIDLQKKVLAISEMDQPDNPEGGSWKP